MHLYLRLDPAPPIGQWDETPFDRYRGSGHLSTPATVRTRTSYRFSISDRLGDRSGLRAIWLIPIKPGAGHSRLSPIVTEDLLVVGPHLIVGRYPFRLMRPALALQLGLELSTGGGFHAIAANQGGPLAGWDRPCVGTRRLPGIKLPMAAH